MKSESSATRGRTTQPEDEASEKKRRHLLPSHRARGRRQERGERKGQRREEGRVAHVAVNVALLLTPFL
jgi:hypothetical protein